MYGSFRVGVRNSELDVLPDKSVIFLYSNVISEMRANIRVAQDYSSFTSPTLVDSVRPLRLVGVTLDKRDFVMRVGYRYQFNGMEADDEIKGQGNSYTTEFRQYDSRLGRWLSTDPVIKVHRIPYDGFNNNPIMYVDPRGDDDYYNANGTYKVNTRPTIYTRFKISGL